MKKEKESIAAEAELALRAKMLTLPWKALTFPCSTFQLGDGKVIEEDHSMQKTGKRATSFPLLP